MSSSRYQMIRSKVGNVVSHLLNVPILTGVFLLFFYLYLPANTVNRTSGFLWSLAILTCLPLTSYFFYIPGKETDHEKVLHRQRMASFLIMMVSYPLGWLVLSLVHAPKIFVTVAINYTCITLGLLLINVVLKYKASGHAAGVAGPIGAMIYLFGIAATPLLALLPIISWARVRAKGHNLLQTIVGAALSFATTVIIFWVTGYHAFSGVIK